MMGRRTMDDGRWTMDDGWGFIVYRPSSIVLLPLRWRAASNKMTAAAVAAFSDSVPPAIGMLITLPANSPASSLMPWASLEIMSAVGSVHFTASYVVGS